MAEEKALGLSVLSTIRDWVKSLIPTKTSDLTNDSGYITGMTILSYGNSTWSDFLAAYNANKVVYARASSNANPASGSQTRLAFMAYVDNAASPTFVEFQYYRSVSSHSVTQQGDQVYVYTLRSSGWSVITRENYTKIAAGTNMSQSYASGTLTLNATQPSVPQATSTTPLMDGTAAVGSETKWAKGDHVHPTDTSRQELLVSGTNIKTINNTSLLGSGNITIEGGSGGVEVATATATLTVAGWSNNRQTVNVTGVTASNDVIVTYAVGSKETYTASDIYCYAQGAGTLTFACATTPTEAITVNVMIIDGGTTIEPMYSIRREDSGVSVTDDGTYGANVTSITQALSGTVITVGWKSPDSSYALNVVVESEDNSVIITNVALTAAQTYFTFTMPAMNIKITTNASGGDN